MWPTRFAIACLTAAVLTPHPSQAQTPTRDQILAYFAQANAPSDAAASPPSPAPPTDTLEPMLAALEQIAAKKPDPDLLRALFEYQLAHPGAQDPRPALAMGRLFWAQSKTFAATYRSLPAVNQIRLMPYLEFGWKQCIRGKVKSGRHFQQIEAEFDRLRASMINAR